MSCHSRDGKEVKIAMYFIGAKRSQGTMANGKTGEPYHAFLTKAEERILKPIFVAFGEMKVAKDERKTDTVLLRFLSDEGNIKF